MNTETLSFIDTDKLRGLVSKLKRFVSRGYCWWFGCDPDHGNAMSWYDEDDCGCNTPCKRCDNYDVSYADMVGDTRHASFKEWCNYWLFRKWWPVKCKICGRRWRGCENDEAHFDSDIPF